MDRLWSEGFQLHVCFPFSSCSKPPRQKERFIPWETCQALRGDAADQSDQQPQSDHVSERDTHYLLIITW